MVSFSSVLDRAHHERANSTIWPRHLHRRETIAPKTYKVAILSTSQRSQRVTNFFGVELLFHLVYITSTYT